MSSPRTFSLDLHCKNVRFQVDEALIRQKLAHAPGIDTVEVDWTNGHVKVKTQNQDGGLDVLERLADAGYPAVEDPNYTGPR